MVDRAKFAADEGRLTILGRSVHVTDAMRSFAEEKISKIQKLAGHVMHIEVTLDVQRMEHLCGIVVKLKHFVIRVGASSSDMYASIDEAVKRLEAKLRRWKGFIQDHLAKKLSEVDLVVNVIHYPYNAVEEINAAIEQETARKQAEMLKPPSVDSTETRPLRTLTLHEAVMKLDLSDDPFILYKSEEDLKLKVLYRRKDGHFGLILPE